MSAVTLAVVLLLAGFAAADQPAADGLARAQAAQERADFKEATRLLDALASHDLSQAERARLHQIRAAVQAGTGEYELALRSADEAERLAQGLDNPRLRAAIEQARGAVSYRRGAPLQAIAYYKKSLEWAERAADPGLISKSYSGLSNCYTTLDDVTPIT